jgi:hypothetical protein
VKTFILQTIFLLLFLVDLNAQTKKQIAFGCGFNSTLSYQPQTNIHYIGQGVPSMPVTPCLNFKINRHEILLGADLYFEGPLYNKVWYPLIIGGQGEYRFHFLNPNKNYNLFLHSTIQYVQFQNGYGLYATPYNNSYKFTSYDAVLLKVKSLINTYGAGVELTLLKRIHLYSAIGLGINYIDTKVIEGDYYMNFQKDKRFNFIGNVRLGISFSIYKNNTKADT